MSPKQFVEEFDGPKMPAIARYFRELKEWGFIEVVEELRGGDRRGAVECVYQAIRRIHFDTPNWEVLPRYLRRETSGVILEGLMARIAEAVRAGTFDGGWWHLSCQRVRLDRQAWSEYVTHLDGELNWLTRMEIAASNARPAACLLPGTVGLLAFRAPGGDLGVPPRPLPRFRPARTDGPHFLFHPLTAKAMSNPWRNRILIELDLRPMSPKQFAEKFSAPDLAIIARHFRQLRDWGYLEIADELRGGARRGAVEKVHRAVQRFNFDKFFWEPNSRDSYSLWSNQALPSLLDQLDEAIKADTLDLETDRHLSWISLELERSTWNECRNRLERARSLVFELESESAHRLACEGEAVPATVALMTFPAPVDSPTPQ
jgi:hypothetical protein